MNGEIGVGGKSRWCGAKQQLGAVILLCDYGPDDHLDMHWDQLWGIEWRNRAWTHHSKTGIHEGQTTLEEQIKGVTP